MLTIITIIFQSLLIPFVLAAPPRSNVKFLGLIPPISELLEPDSPIPWYAGDENIKKIADYLSVEFYTLPLEGVNGDYGMTADLVPQFVHHYFAATWGWELHGLARFGYLRDLPDMHGIKVLSDGLPDLAVSLRQAAIDGKRLSLNETATVVATIERLVLDEFLPRFFESFYWYGTTPWHPQPRKNIADMLLLFLAQYHSSFSVGKPKSARYFIENFIVRYDFLAERVRVTNPFAPKTYNSHEIFSLFRFALESYTQLQQRGCVRMHDDLKRYMLPDRTLPVSASLTPGMHEEGFEFSESIEYLEATGAMPEKSAKVWLPNYMAGPSNCDLHLRHVLTCCASLCTPILRKIAKAVRGPEVDPDKLIQIVSNISSRYVDAPESGLESNVVKRIHLIAEEHGGRVQIHSRSFDQWIHMLFPEECFYPALTDKALYTSSSNIWWTQMAQGARANIERAKAARFEIMKEIEEERGWHPHEVLYIEEKTTVVDVLRLIGSYFAMLLSLVAAARVAIGLRNSSRCKSTRVSSNLSVRKAVLGASLRHVV